MKQQATLLLIWLLSLSTICLAQPVSTAKELALLDMTLLALTRSSAPEEVAFYKTLVGERFKALEMSVDAELLAELKQRRALLARIRQVMGARWQQAQVVDKEAPVAAIFLIDELASRPNERKDGRALTHLREMMWQAMLKHTQPEPMIFPANALRADEVLIQQHISSGQPDGTEMRYLVANLTTKQLAWRTQTFDFLPETLTLLASVPFNLEAERRPFVLIIKGHRLSQYLRKHRNWLAASQYDIHFILLEEDNASYVALQNEASSLFGAPTQVGNPVVFFSPDTTCRELVSLIYVPTRSQLGMWPLSALNEQRFSKRVNEWIKTAQMVFRGD